MKDSARFAIEAALHHIESEKATSIQCKMRQKLAQRAVEKRRKARNTIQRSILSYIIRKRWQDTIMNFAQ